MHIKVCESVCLTEPDDRPTAVIGIVNGHVVSSPIYRCV